MIWDVLIIKDGLPLLSKSFSNSSNVKNMFSEIDNLIMVSGFFSALNSFSDSFEDLGTISELKLSNNNLKLSFLKDANIPDLIFLATYDSNSELINVQKFLQIISNLFLKNYSYNQIINWNGRLNSFKEFESVVEEFIEKEEKLTQAKHDDNVVSWLRSFEENMDVKVKLESDLETVDPNPDYYNFIPIFTTAKKINPKHYLTGEVSCKIYENIDGKKTINQITKELNVEHNRVYNICKNLIKMGFISFT
ncbi:MAG: hypothetical protein ACFE8B_00355 [Candidatus Hermodarchaeota archaeon]